MTTPGSRPSDEMLVNVPRLITAYYSERPDPSMRDQRVAFGTSGHRGSSLNTAFNELHILHNRGRKSNLADGIAITPSHNPPEDGGFKYNYQLHL